MRAENAAVLRPCFAGQNLPTAVGAPLRMNDLFPVEQVSGLVGAAAPGAPSPEPVLPSRERGGWRQATACAVAFWVLAVIWCGVATAQSPAEDGGDQALIEPMASRSLLLDVTTVGGTLVAVGERGHILLSGDAGASWRQVPAPTSSTLTAVAFASEQVGFAVGHDAVILRTRDGGNSWQRVHWAPEDERPLLDVSFADEKSGFAVGAYGCFLETADGGDTWTDRRIAEEDVHLNQIARASSGTLYIAAESGKVFRSADHGASWEALPSPYEGSFFGSLPLAGDSLLLYGLRGHLFRSDDGGATWRAIATGTTEMLTAGLDLGAGRLLLCGLGGVVLESADGGQTFALRQRPDRLGNAGAARAANGTVVLVGEQGVRLLAASELVASSR
jgi:photosystem II stability/assembly factor-like uncharacterized protein